jgi:ABC-type lipoprotein release transport system permease subunit
MILKNMLRRKARTMLTIIGISIGVAAIITLGALANGLGTGYQSMLSGSKADLILSQPDSFDIAYSSIDESLAKQVQGMPEVANISGMLQGFSQTENEPFFFVFGYPEDSFVLSRFQITSGVNLNSREVQRTHGKPLLLGSAAAEVLKKATGDTLRLGSSVFRIVGIYQTGDAFEDSGALMGMEDAQDLLGKPRQVSLFYVQLKDPSLRERFVHRVERQLTDLEISGVDQFANKQTMDDMLKGYVWVIGGLAIIIGGVGMMNSQLMAVFERTREIGVLRAVGWNNKRVMWLILGETMSVCLAGGVLGVAIGYLLLNLISKTVVLWGVSVSNLTPDLLSQAFVVVFTLGLAGGLYPAWRASRLEPVEALRYEGGTAGKKVRRLPIGSMAVQSLWQRATRTLLTLGAIGITVGAIIALEAMVRSLGNSLGSMVFSEDAQIILRQADVADTSLSAIDERIGDKLQAMPEVKGVSGLIFSAVMLPDSGSFFIVMGYDPNQFAVQQLNLIAGKRISTNHEVMIGKLIATVMNKKVGDTIELSGTRFRVVGIYESKVGWEEMGGAVTLRDAQTLVGRPRKVTMYSLMLRDPSQAAGLVERINREFPEVHSALAGQFAEQMPDMQNSEGMMNAISFIAILVGGVGVLNTMLMAVIERTREIGVLRALGWRRREVLAMIIKEALLLGVLGGAAGIVIAFLLAFLMTKAPMIGAALDVTWEWDIFARAILIAVLLGLFGGIYPAYRATKLQPVEALRYE